MANNSDEYAAPSPLMNNSRELAYVVLVDPDKDVDLQGNIGQFKWATASPKQIVVLIGITLAVVIDSFGNKILDGSYVRAGHGAVAKLLADRDEPDHTK